MIHQEQNPHIYGVGIDLSREWDSSYYHGCVYKVPPLKKKIKGVTSKQKSH